jgi:trehalose utilization protein
MKLPATTRPVTIDRRMFVRQAALTAGVGCLGPLALADNSPRTPSPIRVRIWCEGTAPKSVYPHDIDGALGDFLAKRPGLKISRARLDDADAGLSDAALDGTDTLIWWGRLRHNDLPDSRAKAIAARVRAGTLGFIALHASCLSKPFIELMGGPCELGGFREDGRPERVEIKDRDHPIARGVAPFTIPRTSMFAEPFQVPKPDSIVLMSTFDRGETFRSGMTWTVQKGRVAYFRPGHDGFPVLFHPSVRQVIANSVEWSARRV